MDLGQGAVQIAYQNNYIQRDMVLKECFDFLEQRSCNGIEES